MNKAISMAFLAAGIMLTIFGVNEMHSFSSDITRLFTGSPTDRSIWMIVGGVVLVVIGLTTLIPGSSKN